MGHPVSAEFLCVVNSEELVEEFDCYLDCMLCINPMKNSLWHLSRLVNHVNLDMIDFSFCILHDLIDFKEDSISKHHDLRRRESPESLVINLTEVRSFNVDFI